MKNTIRYKFLSQVSNSVQRPAYRKYTINFPSKPTPPRQQETRGSRDYVPREVCSAHPWSCGSRDKEEGWDTARVQLLLTEPSHLLRVLGTVPHHLQLQYLPGLEIGRYKLFIQLSRLDKLVHLDMGELSERQLLVETVKECYLELKDLGQQVEHRDGFLSL